MEFPANELKCRIVVHNGLLDAQNLLRNHTEHLDLDAVELTKQAQAPACAKPEKKRPD